MNHNSQSGPRVPVRPAPPPPTASNQQQTVTINSKRSSINITKLLPNIIRKSNNTPSQIPAATTAKKKAPPRPPPPKFQPKKQVIDLLSGSPPSSPSPTLRSQESGFEEDPELWRVWPDSSRSTPSMDWPPSEPMSPVVEAQSTAGLVRPPSSMPTIIRTAPSRRTAKQQQTVGEEDSPPMPNYPPPAPPPDLEEESGACHSWRAVALYDFAASHADDLPLQAGDEVEILSNVDENWLLGRVGDLIGHFPACFVQEI